MALFGGIALPDRPDPENVRKLDLVSLPMIRRMGRFGMRIDVAHFKELEFRLGERMRDLRADIVNEIPADALERFLELVDPEEDDEVAETEAVVDDGGLNIESTQKIAELLYDVLGLHLGKVEIKKTKGGKLSTGRKTLEQLKREHPVVQLILDYREASKLRGTYARAMPRKAILHPRGPDCPVCGRHHYCDEYRVHTKLLSTRTATGRLASKDPNLANIPARSKLGREIRAGFIPSEGHVISQRDFSQIEVRLLADRSNDPLLIRIFHENLDPHIETAMRAFDISDPKKVDKLLHRAPAKNVTFGVIYGLQEQGLVDLMASTYATADLPLPDFITTDWCHDFIEKWFAVYPGARRYLNDEESRARRYGINWTAAGRVRRIPEVRSYHAYIQSAGVRQGNNHGIQGYSADLMRLSMGELGDDLRRLREYDIESYELMSIYDELLVETPEDNGETVQAVMGEVMDNVLVDRSTGILQCRVPIKSDGKVMNRWLKE